MKKVLKSILQNTTDKRKSSKVCPENSTKEPSTPKRKQFNVRNKTKATCVASSYSRRDTRSSKNKRQKVSHEAENASNKKTKRDTAVVVTQNPECSTSMETTISTPPPTRSSRRSAGVSDSGVGTIEKSGGPSTTERRSRSGRAESSDRERAAKSYELFSKRVDQARRGYRKRGMPIDTDSSDE